MARTRDYRRHQYQIRKKRVRKRLRWWELEPTPFRLGKYADTPKPCSCYMCGNPHRYWNEMTRQELRAQAEWDYDLIYFR